MRIVRMLLGIVLALTVVLIMMLVTSPNNSVTGSYSSQEVSKYVVPTYNQPRVIYEYVYIPQRIQTHDSSRVRSYVTTSINQNNNIECTRTIMTDRNKNPEVYARSCSVKPTKYQKERVLIIDNREQITTNLEIPYW